jgi:hypothetical protein
MIAKHKQLFRHDPDSGVYGDCYRTVVACLLGKEPAEVPHFCDGPDDGKVADRVRTFLRPQGMALIEVPFGPDLDLAVALQIGSARSEGMHYLLTGKSKIGSNHVVICRGDEIVHDPSLTNSGIVGPCSGGLFWIGWLVRFPPCDAEAA